MLVFDATPLIYLAKVEKLHLLGDIDKKRVIPRAVFEEVVVKGKEAGKVDALMIERLIEQGVFRVVEVEETDIYKKLKENRNLSKADVEVLALAKIKDGIAIVDEDYARGVADICELHPPSQMSLKLIFLYKTKTTHHQTKHARKHQRPGE